MGSSHSSANQYIENDALIQKMTDIMTNNTDNVNNVVQLSNNVDIEVGPNGELDCSGGLTITQSNQAKARMIVRVTEQTTADLRNLLTNDLQASGNQTNKLIQGFLANLGQITDTDLSQTVINRISNVINNYITTNNLNNIINQVQVANTTKIIVNGKLSGDLCTILQQNTVDFVATNILSNVFTAVTSDQVLNRAVAQATQVNTVQQKGLDDLVKAFTGPLAIIAAAIIIGVIIFVLFFFKSGGDAVSGVGEVVGGSGGSRSKKIVIGIGIILLLIVVFLYYRHRKRGGSGSGQQYWICQTNSGGFNTGLCSTTDATTAASLKSQGQDVFDTQELCENAVSSGARCQQYWKCDTDSSGLYTGTTTQCLALVDKDGMACPYSGQGQAVAVCQDFVYRCDRSSTTDSSGDVTPTATCDRINPDQASPNDEVYHGSSPVNAESNCTGKCVPSTT